MDNGLDFDLKQIFLNFEQSSNDLANTSESTQCQYPADKDA